ncbi:MAG: hypothetical protein DRP65_01855 [Planctomycetota bacterium]|nr:MAG: hypothetical protein DRP65_01855 [Planctomycetota bacterium]
MKQAKQNGFTMFVVVLFIWFFGMALFVLSAASRTMVVETNRMALEAVSRNLESSGRAWVRQNKQVLKGREKGFAVKLNVDDLGGRSALCEVVVGKAEGENVGFTISASCRKGRWTLERSVELGADGCISGAPTKKGIEAVIESSTTPTDSNGV